VTDKSFIAASAADCNCRVAGKVSIAAARFGAWDRHRFNVGGMFVCGAGGAIMLSGLGLAIPGEETHPRLNPAAAITRR